MDKYSESFIFRNQLTILWLKIKDIPFCVCFYCNLNSSCEIFISFYFRWMILSRSKLRTMATVGNTDWSFMGNMVIASDSKPGSEECRKCFVIITIVNLSITIVNLIITIVNRSGDILSRDISSQDIYCRKLPIVANNCKKVAKSCQ